MKARGDYINGRFVRRRRATGELLSIEPAAPTKTIAAFPTFAEAPAEAIAAARAALPAWAANDIATRLAGLRRLLAQLRNRGEDLASLLSRETGRPLWETRSEVRAMQAELDGLLRGALGELEARATPGGAEVRFLPVGVVGVLSPYPQPLLLLHCDAMAAVAAGCAVVCKPSPRTPASAQLYAELIDEADLPRGVFNLVLGGDAAGESLVSGGLDALLFCGSENNAAQLQRNLALPGAPRLRTVTTGMSAALVLNDANLDQAAYQIAIGAFITAGQRCTSTRRVIVDRRVAQPLIERLQPLIERLVIGPVAKPDVFMGPLVDEGARKRCLETVARLEDGGAETLVRGRPLDPSSGKDGEAQGAFVTPSLLELTPKGLTGACAREIASPVLLLCRADGLERALELEAATPYVLSTSVFTRSRQRFGEALRRLRGGLCLQNAPTTRWPGRLPLQPGGRSGNHWPWGIFTTRVCTQVTVSARDETAFDPTILPPGMPPVGL